MTNELWNHELWNAFQQANHRRRAVRDFDGAPIPDGDVRAVLDEAMLAPSSMGLQPYRLHWVRNDDLRARVADACNGQRGARSASTLIVVEAGRGILRETLERRAAYVEHSTELSETSRAWHQKELHKHSRLLRFAPSWLLAPIATLLSLLRPVRTMLPMGPNGVRHWTARSSLYAAQTLMLAAAARGIDSCPMEGFDAVKVSKLLHLARESVIPIVIALGYRRAGARIEPRWRRSFDEVVVTHA